MSASRQAEEARDLACACLDDAPTSVWWRIGGGAFLAMNGMVLSMAVNGSEVSADERYILELAILFISIPVLVLLSSEFLTATWRNLRRGRLSLELLFLLGILSSLGASALYFVRRTGNGYADVAAMLLVVYALGRQIGAYGKQRVLKSLDDWAPERRKARRVDGEVVAASLIAPGDVIRVLPGECVPVDALILHGTAYFHEASVSGESMAVSRGPGERILAGSFPLDASVDCRATEAAAANQIDQIRALIEAGLARPGKEQRLAIDVLRWFVPVVLGAALLAFAIHMQSMPWDRAAFVALAVIVVACPCALGFATPLAVWTALGRLRELGILARSGDAVERLAEIDTIVFDKTGTLTLPEEYDVDCRVEPAWQGREAELRFLLREAELASQHPLSKALAPIWEDAQVLSTTSLQGVRLLPGVGIEATFRDGRKLFAGSAGDDRRIRIDVDAKPAAYISLQERHAPSASPALRALERAGLKLILTTGDSAERASAVPIEDRLARQTPADKHALMQRLHAEGHRALFVGDGINDAAAMAWSHLSCAAAASADLVQDVSSLVFLHRDWTRLPTAIAIAKAARKVVRWNIGFSLAYNFVGIVLGVAGVLHPIASALFMTVSSLTVIIYSMHLMDWEPEADPDIAALDPNTLEQQV